MKLYSRIFVLAFALSACATAAPPAPAPTPQPAQPPRPETPVTPTPTVTPGQPLTVMPENWWLLDSETNGVYGAGVDRAYREILSKKQPRRAVVVAIIDSGVDIRHEDLDAVLWVNPKETRNSRDDDGNGYVDDINGWNFIGGADGRQVGQDTYEVTRLHSACLKLYGPTPAATAPAEKPTKAECATIATDFQAKRQENEQTLAQVKQMDVVFTGFVKLLKEQLRTDTLTVEKVRALTSVRNDVRQAQQAYLQLAQQGVTLDIIKDEVKRIEDLLKYGLNPDFNPRPIVGDNYANPTEKVYGNNEVTGPDASHGTGVAGIVAAERDTKGVSGIATNVKIMTVRTVPDGDERDKDVANAIRYAVDNGANVINMSFGKAYSPYKAVVDAAVKYADSKGVLMIHAAGNDAKDLATEKNFPSQFYADGGKARNWIEVGASNWEGREKLAADFSNFGREQVDVFAPGTTINSTSPNNEYHAASGTSFAAPVVSGIAAMLMAYYPDLTAADVRRIILESATPLKDQMVLRPGSEDGKIRFGDLSVTGAVVNAYKAVLLAEQATRPKS
jgi:subtilisin family serine protease